MKDKIKQFLKNHFNLILYIILNVLTLLTNLLATIKLTSLFSVSEYGNYSLAISFISLVILLGINWSASSIIYVGVKENEQSNTLRKTLTARLIIVSIMSLIVISLLVILHKKINYYLGIDALSIILFYYIANIFITTITNYLLAIKRQLLITSLELVGTVLSLILLLTNEITIAKALVFNIIGQSVVILGIFFFRKQDLKLNQYDKKHLQEVFKFSRAQFLGYTGGYFVNYGTTLLINYYLTKEELGIYNLSFRLFSNVTAVTLLLNTFYASSVVAMIHKKNIQEIKRYFYRTRPILIFTYFLGTISLFFIGPIFIKLIFKEKYILSIKPFLIFLLANIPMSIEVFYVSVYNSLEKQLILQIVIIAQALIAFGLMVFLIPKYNIYGAVISIVISYYIKTIISFLYLERKIYCLLTNTKK